MSADSQRLARLAEVRSKMELQIAKQRGGPTGTLDLFCDLGCAYVGDSHR